MFTSSVAVYGGTMPDVVQDDTALNPQSSYGTQKAIAELLLSDYTRRGFVDGRVLRLPTISVRPGKPNAAAAFASGIIRELLNGERSVCPVDGKTRVWLLSPRSAIDRAKLGNRPIINLPGLCVSVDEMVAALREVAGDEAVARIDFQPEERIEKIVRTWPGAWNNWASPAIKVSPMSSVPISPTNVRRAARKRPHAPEGTLENSASLA